MRDETAYMKRIALLFVCGALVASAQEIRLSRAAMLRSERTMISLRAGTIVEVLSRDEWTLTVRFNNYTGIIPASSLASGTSSKQADGNFGSFAGKTVSPFGNGVKPTDDVTTNGGRSNAKKPAAILAAN